MAGLEGYESVYRGRAARSWEMNPPYSQKYHGREVIHPLDIPVMHPLAEDNPPIDDDGEFSFFFYYPFFFKMFIDRSCFIFCK